ncbi:hypothetical protein WJX82_008907 [Trebouxia sp. C0006]
MRHATAQLNLSTHCCWTDPGTCLLRQTTEAPKTVPCAQGFLMGESQSEQDLSFTDTLVKLEQQFHQLSSNEVLQYLTATAGNYHTAFALIQQCLGEDLAEQDSAKQYLELKDLAVAQQLQKEEDSSPKSVLYQFASSSTHELAPMQQDGDAEQPVTEEPSMQQKVKKLKGQFPHVSYERLQNLLTAHEGCIIKTSRVLRHEKRADQSCGASQKVTEAKEQIAVCKREGEAAQKKVQPTKNAERSNTFKLDLHALHVDEALDEVAKTISDLSKMKCIWKVEVVTGKGLHSVKQNPKLLPAVKQYLAARLIEFWNAPGMVVFMLRPSAD